MTSSANLSTAKIASGLLECELDSVQVFILLYFYRVENASELRDSDYMHVCTFACALHSAHMSSSSM